MAAARHVLLMPDGASAVSSALRVASGAPYAFVLILRYAMPHRLSCLFQILRFIYARLMRLMPPDCFISR